MDILLENISKRFGNTLIAKDLSLRINTGERWHIAGPNGRGKSTLMQILAGYISPDKGKLSYTLGGETIRVEQVFRHISLSTPYTDLIGDFSLDEQLRFHFGFKEPLYTTADIDTWLKQAGLDKVRNRQIAQFSSGMKQKLKLILTLCSKADAVFLDEPCSNLDADGRRFYAELVEERLKYSSSWVVCSNNIRDEHFFCTHTLDLGTLS